MDSAVCILQWLMVNASDHVMSHEHQAARFINLTWRGNQQLELRRCIRSELINSSAQIHFALFVYLRFLRHFLVLSLFHEPSGIIGRISIISTNIISEAWKISTQSSLFHIIKSDDCERQTEIRAHIVLQRKKNIDLIHYFIVCQRKRIHGNS